MNRKEIEMFLGILDQCGSMLNARVCDDYRWPEGVSDEHTRELVRRYHELNGDPEEFELYGSGRLDIEESCLLYLLANDIKNLLLDQSERTSSASKHVDTKIISGAMRELGSTIQCDDGIANASCHQAAERLDELEAETKYLSKIIQKQGGILTRIANAIHGQSGEVQHSHHDLPELVEEIVSLT